jgi:putative intracellular protease/amidase
MSYGQQLLVLMCLSFILNLKSKMCGHGIILAVGYHFSFTVGPRFALRAVNIGFMVAIVNICLCQYHSTTAAAAAAYVIIGHPGGGQWAYWQTHFNRDSLGSMSRIKHTHCCR